MSLCPEAAAFLGTPRVTLPATRSVRLLTGNKPSEELAADIPQFINSANEDTMPKTADPAKPKRKYTRRQPAGCATRIEDAPPPITTGRKPRQEKPSGVVFSVDSTGALLIRRGDHGMEFARAEVLELKAFMARAETMWGDK